MAEADEMGTRTTGTHKPVSSRTLRRTTGRMPVVTVKKTLLVIDDEPGVAKLIQKLFERRGYRILVATDGKEGLERVRLELPDLVLLDIQLPHVDGLEVCRRLQADAKTRHIPILLMSAEHITVKEAQAGLALGAVEFVIKPFVGQVLVHNVERILSTRG